MRWRTRARPSGTWSAPRLPPRSRRRRKRKIEYGTDLLAQFDGLRVGSQRPFKVRALREDITTCDRRNPLQLASGRASRSVTGGFLTTIAEHEIAQCARCRSKRHLVDARLRRRKSIRCFKLEAASIISRPQGKALAGDGGLSNCTNTLPSWARPVAERVRLAAAMGLVLVENG